MKAIIYCRKSTESEEKQVQSIEAQLDWCRNYAKNLNFEVVEEITEEKSAKQPWRVWFNKLMQVFSKNKADVIITWKLNRLSRNPIDEWTIKWLTQQFIIKEIHTSDWVSNWHNILLMSVHFGMATQFLVDLSKDIKRWNKKKAQNWEWSWRSPLGYIVKDKIISVDKKYSHFIKKIFDLKYNDNLNNEEIARDMRLLGLRTRTERRKWKLVWWKPITHKWIWRILENPFYIWYIQYKWELFQGKHKPLVEKHIFDAINSKEKKIYNRTKVWILKWIVRHTDGRVMSSTQKTKTLKSWEVKFYTYYCTSSWNRLWVSEKELIKQFEKMIDLYSLTEKRISKIKDELLNYHNKLISDSKESKVFINEKIEELEQKKSWYIEMRASWELEHEEFVWLKNWITNEIVDLKQRSKEISQNDGKVLEDLSNGVELMKSFWNSYKLKTDEEKLSIMKNLVVELKLDNQKRLYIKENNLFQFVKTSNFENWWS